MASLSDETAAPSAVEVLAGGGEMGALMRALDWAATPLGPVEGWPRSLITAVTLILESRYPMLVVWGSDLIQFYNDAFRPILGATKHPAALGQRASDCWAEIWDVIAPLFARVREAGEAIWMDDLPLLLDRYGYLEETHFAFSYSPIRDDSGRIGGILVTCTETTERVLGERRLRTLRDLAARTAAVKTIMDVCTVSAATLAENQADIPCALLYLLDGAGAEARLAAMTGCDTAARAIQDRLDLAASTESDALWPLAQAARTGQAALVGNTAALFGAISGTAEAPAPRSALALPVIQGGQERPAALLVAGITPRRALDDDYRSFFSLVAGQIATAIANARAYEEERERAEALAELDRAKTAFFSNVSHEFRTPLTLALAPLGDALADTSEPLPEHQHERLEIAYRNSLRLLRLVNTLLDFSRIEAGRAEASYEPTDLAVLTAELAGVFRSAVERAGLRLRVDCPPLPQPVYVDHEMWEKIVLNLLSNAFKFTFEGEIAVGLRAEGEHLTLTVRDTGTGIAAAELPHLFERFHRVRGARARTHEGTGIGLALAHDLVRLHGGAIEVESAPGVGSTFTVRLPLGTAHLPAERIGAARTQVSTALGAAPYVEEALRWLPNANPLEEAEGERLAAETGRPGTPAPVEAAARILLADDNADMRAYLRRLLGARYAVEAVANGAEALAAAQAHPPDLVLADVMMPGLDGFALLQALRADPRTRTLPVILLSARAGQEATAAGLQAGADDYLVKPFAASELLARVQAHLALARLRQEARDTLMTERDRLQDEVAARAQAEEALRTSRDHLQLALTAARMVAWEWDPHADVVTTSENIAEVYGIARVEASTQGFPLVHPDDRARHEATVRQAVQRARGYESTFRIIRPDTGAVVWLEERAAAVVDATGALQKLTGVVLDVSDRARGEAELRQQAALLALAHDAIIVRAPAGRIITWNDGATTLYGWPAAEAVGQSMHDLLRTRVLASGGPGAETDAVLATHGAWGGELEHTRRDGTRLVVESRQALLRAPDGTPEAILEVNRDIAPRLELATALARVQRLQAVSDAALAQLTLPALLRQVLEHITAALEADNTAILLLDETEQFLIVHTALGPEEAQTGQMRVPVGQGVAGHIAATRQPLIVADLRTVEPVNPLLREQLASLMGVPLLVEGRLIGVMHVDSATPRQFSDDDLHLLQLVAGRVALALDNARLYHDALEARDQVARLQRVTAALSAAMTAGEVADVIVTAGVEALGAVAGYVGLLSEDGSRFITVRLSGYAPEVRAAWALVSDDAVAPLSDAVHAREPVILESGQQFAARYPQLAAVRAAAGGGAAATIPLLLGDRAIGALALGFAGPRRFSVEERAVMSALGELCAQALERARLYEGEQQAHAAAEAERDRLQQVLDVLPVGVVIVDAHGQVEILNQAGQEIIGIDTRGQPLPASGEEVDEGYRVRRPDGTPYPPSEVPLSRSLCGEEVRGDQQLHRHAITGRETPLLVNSAPLCDVEGTIVGAVAVFHDISAIRDLERAREEFLSSAAHDLKTPLTGIRGQAQLAQRRLARLPVPAAETQAIAAALRQVDAGTQRMVNLIDELIDVTRLQMGTLLELERRPADLLALVRAVVAEHDAAAPGRLRVQTDLAALHGAVDTERLERVVGNLLSNALKYSPAGGAIEVRVMQEEGPTGPQVLIAVRDEGLGIPATDLPHIFERFYRAGNVVGQVQGTGIGLASARQIVEQHGGTIAVESVEGQGATFTVRLPLVAP